MLFCILFTLFIVSLLQKHTNQLQIYIYSFLYKIPIIQKKPRQLKDGYLSLLDVFVDPSLCVFFFVLCYTTILLN